MADANDVASAVPAASAAFPGWRRTLVQTSVQDLFKFKQLLEKNADHMACLTTRENGKTLLKHRRNCCAGSKTSKSRVACLP
jgi:malonate-semialdehyde dehydrogenase (acetylating)/methylmalonate-semialdehyde dehydrogenase